jgi:hypothetical protein
MDDSAVRAAGFSDRLESLGVASAKKKRISAFGAFKGQSFADS